MQIYQKLLIQLKKREIENEIFSCMYNKNLNKLIHFQREY